MHWREPWGPLVIWDRTFDTCNFLGIHQGGYIFCVSHHCKIYKVSTLIFHWMSFHRLCTHFLDTWQFLQGFGPLYHLESQCYRSLTCWLQTPRHICARLYLSSCWTWCCIRFSSRISAGVEASHCDRLVLRTSSSTFFLFNAIIFNIFLFLVPNWPSSIVMSLSSESSSHRFVILLIINLD